MIREFREADREAVDQLQFGLQQYFAEIDQSGDDLAYKSLGAAHMYMEKMIKDVREMNGRIFVAEDGGKVIGFVQGVIIEHKKGEDRLYDLSRRANKEGWVGLLYVSPGKRGLGIGKKLFNAIEDFFRSENCTHIKLLTLAENKNAINFYREAGLTENVIEMSKILIDD